MYSLALILLVLVIGTTGMRRFEGLSTLDAFYFVSMIATSQGPTLTLHTDAGKLFAAFMAFISVGTVVAALGFLFGPFLGKLFHIGAHKLEGEIERLGRRQ